MKATYVYSQGQRLAQLNNGWAGHYYVPSKYINSIQYTECLTSIDEHDDYLSTWKDAKIVHITGGLELNTEELKRTGERHALVISTEGHKRTRS